MAALTWDGTGTRFYETGVSHGVLYTKKNDGTYNTGVAWNGLTNVSENPDGAEPTDLWADNIKYATIRSAETFSATIEAYTYPEEFNECDGNKSPENLTGVYIGQQARTPFALSYRTQIGSDNFAADSNEGYKLHIIYDATASPSDKSYDSINDSPDAITFSWEITADPKPITGYEDSGFKPTATIVIDKSKLTAKGKTNLATLEAALYGGDNAEPTLKLPHEVIEIMSAT